MTTRPAATLMLLLGLLLAGCAAGVGLVESPPGPGVPRIANLRFEPEVVRIGETTQMSFYFEVGSADLDECLVVEQGLRQFQLYTALQQVPVDCKRYGGIVAGTVELPMRWSSEGIRSIEVQVQTRQGKISNRLRSLVTVR